MAAAPIDGEATVSVAEMLPIFDTPRRWLYCVAMGRWRRQLVVWTVAAAGCAPLAEPITALTGPDAVVAGRGGTVQATQDSARVLPDAMAELPEVGPEPELPAAAEPQADSGTAPDQGLPAPTDAPVFDQFAQPDAVGSGDLGVAPFDAAVFVELAPFETSAEPAPDAGADTAEVVVDAQDAINAVQETFSDLQETASDLQETASDLQETASDVQETAMDMLEDADTALQPDTTVPCLPAQCDDGEPCTTDGCQPDGSCVHTALADNGACLDGTCQLGICSRNTPQTYGLSCATIKNTTVGAKTGVWWLDPDGPFTPIGTFAAWCDMDGDGGGWTMLLKVAATDSELGYDASYWTSIATLHPEHPRLDGREAKLTSFWALPFKQLRVGMKSEKQTAWLVAAISASSLFHLLKDDKYVPLAVPASNWMGLLPGAALQTDCQAIGLNVRPAGAAQSPYARARIGVIGNDALDCSSPDSRLGVGLAGTTCGQAAALAAGNAAGCLPNGATVNLPVVGYVFAR